MPSILLLPQVLVGLLEPQVSGPKAEAVCRKLGLTNCFRVEAEGRSGGIWLLWRSDSITVNILKENKQFVHVQVGGFNQQDCVVTVVYARPNDRMKKQLWGDLRQLKGQINKPWMVVGDFNSVTSGEEKKGGSPPNLRQCLLFRQWIEDMQLIDMGYSGSPFTWSRKSANNIRRYSRLDRALCSAEWRVEWPDAAVRHLPRIQSDHSPLLMLTKPERLLGQCPFRFQGAWLLHDQFHQFVESVWEKSASLPVALHQFAIKAQEWNKAVFGNIFHKKKHILARLQGIQRALDLRPHGGLRKLHAKLTAELEHILKEEEILWFQKSRRQWIKDGDRNTKYFHLSTLIRRRRNQVDGLRADDGNWVWDPSQLQHMAVRFYRQLYSNEQGSYKDVLPRGSFPRPSEDNVMQLVRHIADAEIWAALHAMAPFKAPGPDGIHAVFYQKMWGSVSCTVRKFVQDFFGMGVLPPAVNETLLVVIPKHDKPERMADFRPISLCNVSYKILTKIIVNRLKPLLPKLISPTQCSFVPGRQISDNIVIIQEVLHTMKLKKGRKGIMAIKLDLEKAYDRLSWEFIRDTGGRSAQPLDYAYNEMYFLDFHACPLEWE